MAKSQFVQWKGEFLSVRLDILMLSRLFEQNREFQTIQVFPYKFSLIFVYFYQVLRSLICQLVQGSANHHRQFPILAVFLSCTHFI